MTMTGINRLNRIGYVLFWIGLFFGLSWILRALEINALGGIPDVLNPFHGWQHLVAITATLIPGLVMLRVGYHLEIRNEKKEQTGKM